MTSYKIKNDEAQLTRKISNELEKEGKLVKNNIIAFLLY